MRTWRWAAGAALVTMTMAGAASAAQKAPARSGAVKRGEFLVTIGGCNDCHTPLKMGPNGPAPDMTRMLSGRPEQSALPPPPKLEPGPWAIVVSADLTAWSGPWGVSYSANLTPDPETGLGKWTAQSFVEAMRTGRHMGRGRPILPPMPWPSVAKLSDSDLKAVFAYLRTVPPLRNQVPEPIVAPPPGGGPPPPSSAAPAAGK